MSRFFLLLDSASNQLYQHLMASAYASKLKHYRPVTEDPELPNTPINPETPAPSNHINTAIGWEVDFEPINAQLPNQDTALRALLAPLSAQLIEAGATRVLVPNITLSLVLRRLELLEKQLIDPIELLLRLFNDSTDQHHPRFTVFGSTHTAHSKVWIQTTLQNAWAFCPSAVAVTERVDQIRRITFGRAASDPGWLESAADELADMMRQEQPIWTVLACSELSQIFQQHPGKFSGLPVIDLASLQTAAFVR